MLFILIPILIHVNFERGQKWPPIGASLEIVSIELLGKTIPCHELPQGVIEDLQEDAWKLAEAEYKEP